MKTKKKNDQKNPTSLLEVKNKKGKVLFTLRVEGESVYISPVEGRKVRCSATVSSSGFESWDFGSSRNLESFKEMTVGVYNG